MPELIVHTTTRTYSVALPKGESLLESMRRANLPLMGFLLLSDIEAGTFASLTDRPTADQTIHALALRNPDFEVLHPRYDVRKLGTGEPVAEIFTETKDGHQLLQLDRATGIQTLYERVTQVLDDYPSKFDAAGDVLQVALSGGGDGRVLGECLGRYVDERPGVFFHAVITANALEDEREHIEAAVLNADRWGLPYTVFNEEAAAAEMGFAVRMGEALRRYREAFPLDEAEVVATYVVQEVNLAEAHRTGRRAILFGFNQEDVIAERLFQAMIGSQAGGPQLDPYPVRTIGDVHLVAPLCRVPKRLIDALDLSNSRRNYAMRVPSVSQLRSALYFLAYDVVERYPRLATAFIDGIEGPDPDRIPGFLRDLR